MEGSQRGWSSFGMLVILAVAVAAGYYAYKGISSRRSAGLQKRLQLLHEIMSAHHDRGARRAGLPGGVPARSGSV